jgi:galactoside O-acetyltransferase
MGRLSQEALEDMGFESVGKNVSLSDKASFYNCAAISIGDNVRIDDFCVLSAGVGGISVGNNVHIAVFSSLMGAGAILLEDFCNISSRVAIYSSTDDYSGATMTNPTVPPEYTGVEHADVWLGKHVIIGTGSVVLPGTRLEMGVAVGALSLIKENCPAFGLYAGVPAKRLKERKRDLLEYEKRYLSEITM